MKEAQLYDLISVTQLFKHLFLSVKLKKMTMFSCMQAFLVLAWQSYKSHGFMERKGTIL